MTSTELRALLVTLGLSQAGAGRVLGVATRTVQQWAAGDRDIPETVRRILTLMVEDSALVERMLATCKPAIKPACTFLVTSPQNAV